MRNWIVVGGVGGIALLAGLLYYLQSHHLFPFTAGGQPIIISDSSVEVQLDGPLNLVDNKHHRIKGKKIHHITMVDGNGAATTVCTKKSCDQTIVWYELNSSGPSYKFDVSEPNGSDTDLGSDVDWNSNFWTPSEPVGQPKLTLVGRLVDQSVIWCQNCVFTICFNDTDACKQK